VWLDPPLTRYPIPMPPPILRQIAALVPPHLHRHPKAARHLRVVGMNATAGATSVRKRAATFILLICDVYEDKGGCRSVTRRRRAVESSRAIAHAGPASSQGLRVTGGHQPHALQPVLNKTSPSRRPSVKSAGRQAGRKAGRQEAGRPKSKRAAGGALSKQQSSSRQQKDDLLTRLNPQRSQSQTGKGLLLTRFCLLVGPRVSAFRQLPIDQGADARAVWIDSRKQRGLIEFVRWAASQQKKSRRRRSLNPPCRLREGYSCCRRGHRHIVTQSVLQRILSSRPILADPAVSSTVRRLCSAHFSHKRAFRSIQKLHPRYIFQSIDRLSHSRSIDSISVKSSITAFILNRIESTHSPLRPPLSDTPRPNTTGPHIPLSYDGAAPQPLPTAQSFHRPTPRPPLHYEWSSADHHLPGASQLTPPGRSFPAWGRSPRRSSRPLMLPRRPMAMSPTTTTEAPLMPLAAAAIHLLPPSSGR
jgi:hypothetical protein